ncbi:small subunit ribosomal protein S9e [Pancytospora epiphaga]|nr:small subunit ribosomal protein S9e [Pancytospora epiphaga]
MGTVIRSRKIASTPLNPWEKDRLVKELHLLGTYGLKNKKELWTALAAARSDKKHARDLLISTNHKEFMTQSRALLNRLCRNGMMSSVDFNDEESIRSSLREVLNFDISSYLNRRLQSLVLRSGIAHNIHHARLLINHKHIVVNGKVVDKPSMVVRSENEGHIELNPRSSLAGFRKSRMARKQSAEDPKEE